MTRRATWAWSGFSRRGGVLLVTLIAVLALAVWAFYVSLAGRQLFKDSVLD